ncbi:MAG: hypothetical protein M1818_003510 [Claussenomyces sp. TS43310]|nr:MAG: hypothetical protein M1818_003510 [Claussenomyces sp. TS43310]
MSLLELVFNHMVLPPKLPGHQDEDTETVNRTILTLLLSACDSVVKLSGQEFANTWHSVQRSLRTCLDINHGRLDKATLLQAFKNLQTNDLLILHVVEQNAALLIRRQISEGIDNVIFEAFESSPSLTNVLAAENALQWDFPGRAAEITYEDFCNESFQDSLAMFLEQASMESLARFSAHSTKAKTSVVDWRDTTDPALVTQMLMPLLEAIGSSVDTPRIRKRVRDDVHIQEATLPWRRAPFWLILRVATQRQLCLTLGNDVGRACYKFLICVVLAQLLEICSGELAPELTVTLRSKLCRRLAKLEMDSTRVSGSVSLVYEELFSLLGPLLRASIEKATKHVEAAWNNFKVSTRRSIPKLPIRADKNALHLSLRNSGEYLKGLLDMPCAHRTDPPSSNLPSLLGSSIERVIRFNEVCFKLGKLDITAERVERSAPESKADCQTRCIEVAGLITHCLGTVRDTCESNPEAISILILNLFDLWVFLDKCALQICPLLAEYHPVFSPDLLDVLQLPRLSEMRRLRDIQNYLQNRCENCQLADKTIFSKPNKECFAARYLRSDDGIHMDSLLQRIQNASNVSRENKKGEWEEASRKYNDLSKKIASGTCVCSFNLDGSRNVRGCDKCWHYRSQKRMEISVHEDLLPTDSAQQAAVIFELVTPAYFSAYRNATWNILSDLAHPSRSSVSSLPVTLLKQHPPLHCYMKSHANDVSLASDKKSFLKTHFKFSRVQGDLSCVLLPLGLDFSYHDTRSALWLKDLDKPLTFHHLCGIHIPRSLRGSVIDSSAHPAPNTDGPSSYETIASQTKCPPDIPIHEFMANQRLLSGKTRRWLTMLVELGASNINFGTEDTMHLFSQLAVQAGPDKDKTNPLRDAHMVFQDKAFCQRLREQIESRLDNIRSNWRETYCMEMLITLSLRLFTLTTGKMRQTAVQLLQLARDITLDWIARLQDEVRSAIEAGTAERAANYGFWAALLCRRTFAIFVEEDVEMNAKDLGFFVRASIALQENLVVDISKMTRDLKNILIRDMKLGYRIRSLVQRSILSNPDSLGAGINETWSDSDNSMRTYSPWKFLEANEGWVMSTITSKAEQTGDPQILHYNFIEGHLLVDGKPLGKLPLDLRGSDAVKELFGNQHLLTFPSSLSGMSHVLATRPNGQQIHFGSRGMSVVIQALTRDSILEYIPRHIFRDDAGFDLPSTLVDDCVHWLDLRSDA